MTPWIVGWAHTPFGRLDGGTLESLIVRVTRAALDNAGFSQQDCTASLVFQADNGFRFKPATRVENACATGSAAVHHPVAAVASGQARLALVVDAERMTATPPTDIGRNLLRASYLPEDGDNPAGFAGVFGWIAHSYFERHGDQSDALAMIAAKNHADGVGTPRPRCTRISATTSAGRNARRTPTSPGR